MSITTKMGDAGETGLLSGARVKKSSLRVECLGVVDEAAAFLGIARCKGRGYVEKCLRLIQAGLCSVMAELSDDAGILPAERLVNSTHTAKLEEIIGYCESVTGPLKSFVVPGDTPLSADLHAARTVVRRAERRIVALHDEEGPLRQELLRYMNRVSDALFALARLSAEGPRSKVTPL
ncbi:MAG: cob(I)yrinic acid a,c-diamide adenosyltransferase [Christensenellales bacterium]|jgi:ATP:cob(I)alamin adenosyltransferase